MLTLDAVDVFYGRVQALRRISLAVGDGEVVALFGSNGAGKSTTLRAISGLVGVAAGEIAFEGRLINGLAPEQTAALGIAHIPEGRGIFPRMTLGQNLKMGGYAARLGANELGSRIEEVLAQFPALRTRLRQPAGTLSGGEQQMAAIARALIARPRVLMLDEPSHGLAPKVAREVFALLGRLREAGMSLLIVEQYATAALSVADRAYVLERGHMTFGGAAHDVRADRLAGAYLGAGR